jgi:hypothetical protein
MPVIMRSPYWRHKAIRLPIIVNTRDNCNSNEWHERRVGEGPASDPDHLPLIPARDLHQDRTGRGPPAPASLDAAGERPGQIIGAASHEHNPVHRRGAEPTKVDGIMPWELAA